MDKVLTFDDLSIGHGLSGREDVTPLDPASGPTSESALSFLHLLPPWRQGQRGGTSLVEE
jgi:hypothetical protein